jgi:hypothetical protein
MSWPYGQTNELADILRIRSIGGTHAQESSLAAKTA